MTDGAPVTREEAARLIGAAPENVRITTTGAGITVATDGRHTVVVDRGLIFISDGGREPDDTVR